MLLSFIAGLLFLVIGAEALVRGASRLAGALGISPLVVGLTVVAFGTGAPELAVCVKSVLSDQAGIALGNVVGSNIFNVLFILGLSAVITPLAVSQQLVKLEVPLLITLSALLLVFTYDGALDRLEGFVLFFGLIAYVWFSVHQSRKASARVEAEYEREFGVAETIQQRWVLNVSLVGGGLGLLVLGSRWLVDSAVSFAHYIGVSELVVGLTIVAVGTSLPEVVTSVIAALRGERDIAVGNVVGSNLFNIMGVMGFASLVAPQGIAVSDALIGFDLPVMAAVVLACLPIFFTGGVISRTEGALLLSYYVAYTSYLFMATSHHDALPQFNTIMLFFVIPITAVALLGTALRELRGTWQQKPE